MLLVSWFARAKKVLVTRPHLRWAVAGWGGVSRYADSGSVFQNPFPPLGGWGGGGAVVRRVPVSETPRGPLHLVLRLRRFSFLVAGRLPQPLGTGGYIPARVVIFLAIFLFLSVLVLSYCLIWYYYGILIFEIV
jgi:hypothetical protein